MKSIIITALVVIFIVASGFQAFGEEWTAEQKEVWNTLVADIENFKTGDVDKLMEARHDDFVGWFGTETDIYDKEDSKLYYEGMFAFGMPKKFDIEPVKILIMGNLANVYYTFAMSSKNYSSEGRAVETIVKEGNRWLLISHMCSLCEKPVPCK